MRESRDNGLTVSGVSKTFTLRSGQILKALDNIDFELEKNSVGVLLGPSGCGKSTLLRIIALLLGFEAGDDPQQRRLSAAGRTQQYAH